jgi:hypothetical protein
MKSKEALQSIQAALDSNNFTAPKQIHVQLQEAIRIISEDLKDLEEYKMASQDPKPE